MAQRAHAALTKIGVAGAPGHIILRMRNLLLCLSLGLSCAALSAAKKDAVKRAFADGKGVVHIVTADGVDHVFHPKKWQDARGAGSVMVAEDGKTVGWLAKEALSPRESGASYSYAGALELDVWRGGRILRRFGPGQDIRDWIFLEGGNEVAFRLAPLHGDREFYCTRFDVGTGKELAHWSLDRKDYVVPDWAKPLLKDDPPPGPDDIANWFPDAPTRTDKTPQPKQ